MQKNPTPNSFPINEDTIVIVTNRDNDEVTLEPVRAFYSSSAAKKIKLQQGDNKPKHATIIVAKVEKGFIKCGDPISITGNNITVTDSISRIELNHEPIINGAAVSGDSVGICLGNTKIGQLLNLSKGN